MNLVCDTHALVWYLADERRRLSRPALRALREAEAGSRTVHIPAIVLMEVALLDQKGRIRVSYRDLRAQLSLRRGLPIEPLTPEDVDEARALATLPDPFDRLIAGTAVRLDLPLLTNDSVVTESGRVRTFW